MSSFSILSYLDTAFVDWTTRLIRHGILDSSHWLMTCPNLLKCSPRVKTLDDDPSVICQLSSMTPVGAFAYVLMRRLAEVVAQIVSCWLLHTWLMLVTVTIFVTWVSKCTPRKGIPNRNTYRGLSPKHLYLLFSVVPLSILIPFLLEMVHGGVLDFQLDFASISQESSLWTVWKIHVLRGEAIPSVLDLLQISSLCQTLYGRSYRLLSPSRASEKLCQQTSVSLMYWSVLAFIGGVCLIILVLLKVAVVNPVVSVIGSMVAPEHKSPVASKKTIIRAPTCRSEEEGVSERCSKLVLERGDKRYPSALHFSTNDDAGKAGPSTSEKLMEHFNKYDYPDPEILFTERGDSHCNVVLPKQAIEGDCAGGDGYGRTAPVAPRYISRGSYANLDTDSSADEAFF